MALDDLYEQLVKLRDDISAHSAYLKSNEAGTRQVLIDPLLEALGWDVANPDQVKVEYGIVAGKGKKVADYVLLHEGTATAVVEAKKLGSELLDAAIDAAMVECVAQGIKYMLVTDGNAWQVYDVFRPVATAAKLVVEFSIADDPICKCAINALVFWRPNLANEHGPTAPDRHLFCDDELSPPSCCFADHPNDNCARFSEVAHGGPRPTRIRFNDGSEYGITRWPGLYVEIAKHLVAVGKIHDGNTPIKLTRGKNHAVNDTGRQPSGKPFAEAVDIGRGFRLQAHNNPEGFVDYSKRLLKYCQVSAETVKVRFD